MTLPKSFVQAWYVWVRAEAPIKNSRLRRHTESTYPIELELDHLVSYLHAMGTSIMAGKIFENYLPQTKDDLATLSQIKMVLENSGGKELEKEKFRNYLSQTEKVYEEIQKYLISKT